MLAVGEIDYRAPVSSIESAFRGTSQGGTIHLSGDFKGIEMIVANGG